MRIALLTNRFPPALDGVGDYSYHLASELQRQGHEVAVLCRQDAAVDQAVHSGEFTMAVSTTVPAWNWLAIKPLRLFIRQYRPDWLLVQYVPNAFQRWAMPVWLPLLVRLSQHQGVRVCITFHELYAKQVQWPLKHWLTRRVQRLICAALARTADELITSIDLYRDLLAHHTSQSAGLIPVPSNIRRVAMTDAEKTTLLHRINPTSSLIISTFGVRNQDILLAVFDQISNQYPDARLLICGTLNVTANGRLLHQRLTSRITVTGFLPAPDVYRHLHVSDVFLLPDPVNDLGEGGTSSKSASLAAGLVAGLPVVGTRGHLNNALLGHIPGLFLGDYQSPADLTQLVQKALTDKQVGPRNAHFAQYELSWAVVATAYLTQLLPTHQTHDLLRSDHQL